MNVDTIYILTYAPDHTVNKSAQGFLFKYMMHQNIREIVVAQIQADFTKIIPYYNARRDNEQSKWIITCSNNWDLKPGNNEEVVSLSAERQEEIHRITDSKVKKTYKNTRQTGAIIASHGTSSTIASLQPEHFALGMLTLSNTENSGVPFFDKIVFNVCRFAAINNKQPEEFWTVDSSKKYKIFNFSETDELKSGDVAHTILDHPKEGFLNCVFRFLNVYGPKSGKELVLAAGYTQGVTAMHPMKKDIPTANKPNNKPNENNIKYNTLEHAGRKVTLDEDHQPSSLMKRKYKNAFVYRTGKGVAVISDLNKEWTD